MEKEENEDDSKDNSDSVTRHKIIFIGDAGTQKTKIINRLMDNPFNEAYEPSIGVDFMSKIIKFRKQNIRLQIWDTAGQEKYKGLIPSYVRNSSLVFLVYRVTDRSTFNNIPLWINFIRSIENVKLVLCGNTNGKNREVLKKEGENLAKKEGMLFYECNPKTNENIKAMFYSSITSIDKLFINKDLNESKIMIIEELLKNNETEYNEILNDIYLKDSNLNEFYKELKINNEKYYVIFKKNSDSSKLLIKCEPEDKLTSLYNYSKEISFDEFILLGKYFKQCDNIDDIFLFLKSIIIDTQIQGNLDNYSKIELEYTTNMNIILIIKIPLLNNKNEEVKIEFVKDKKDLIKQFEILKEKYLNLKNKIYNENKNLNSKKTCHEFINELIEEIEKDSN